MATAGLRSLALAFPSILRDNDFFRARDPKMVEEAENYSLAKLWGRAQSQGNERKASAFDVAMAPYLADPFRGAVERRVRAPGETALSMEITAAHGALSACSMSVDDLDLVLVSSFVPDRFGVGDAAFLAKEMGLRAPAWNYESACSGTLVGLQMATSLIRSGDYRRILVVASTSNSVQVLDGDTIGWFVGDGAGAFVVEAAAPGYGVLGWKTINSVGTNDMFVIHSVQSGEGTRLATVPSPTANVMARDTAEPYLRACVDGALSSAGVNLADVDFWVFNTPNAWYADFCAAVLGIEQSRTHSIYPRYSNIGAVLMPATLYHALEERRVAPGALVGLYSVGSSSTASAIIMRVGDVALGPYPTKPDSMTSD